jgi:hypothetical protein
MTETESETTRVLRTYDLVMVRLDERVALLELQVAELTASHAELLARVEEQDDSRRIIYSAAADDA